MNSLLIALIIVILFSTLVMLFIAFKSKNLSFKFNELFNKLEERSRFSDDLIRKSSMESQQKLTEFLNHSQLNMLKTLQESQQTALLKYADNLSKRVDQLTQVTDNRLKEISGQVEKRLSEGFEKTTATFQDVIKRLALIDEAQKRITELSTNVVSLQEVLTDKRSRGAFGEVQLSSLIHNMLPEKHFELQHTLSNGLRVDCILFLPKPTGNIAIDAKFPLESYQRMTDSTLSAADRQAAMQQFRQDIKKHIQDIAKKYILPNETSDGAMMFIPAEAIFAEIHAHFPDLTELAQRQRVWMVSPTTTMAILTTVKAVLKDEATRKQVHIIQEHLVALSKDFERFQDRMDNLAKHVRLAHEEAEDVNKSARKLTSRFNKIEKVDLEKMEDNNVVLLTDEQE